jgi:thiamine kinase-like enzyme
LAELTDEHIRRRVQALPIWQGLRSVEPLSGGVSNIAFKARDATGAYVVRIGHDLPFHNVNRSREAAASRAAHLAGVSPEVMYSESDLLVIRFVQARTYGEPDVRAAIEACCALIKVCHNKVGRLVEGDAAAFWIFQVLRNYCRQIAQAGHPHAAHTDSWSRIVDRLEEAQVPMPIIFGHHDLLPTNILDDGNRLWLIDWEYASFGSPLFDLANLSSNCAFEPQHDERLLVAYFGNSLTPQIARAFLATKLASGLREGLWGTISEIHHMPGDTDYAAYANRYLARFDDLWTTYQGEF